MRADTFPPSVLCKRKVYCLRHFLILYIWPESPELGTSDAIKAIEPNVGFSNETFIERETCQIYASDKKQLFSGLLE